MADQVLRSLPAVTPAPADFVVPNAAEWVLQVVSATFDGTGAAGAYLPAVQIIGPGGDVAATFADKNVSVAAGSSAEVTFGPFLRSPSAAAASSGIKFDTAPQAGQYLFVETDGPALTPDGFVFEVRDPNGNGSAIYGVPVILGDVLNTNNGAVYLLTGGGHRFDLTLAQEFSVRNGYNGPRIFSAKITAGVSQLGFFGVGPVPKQATPVTLADVIALLQAYGLSA